MAGDELFSKAVTKSWGGGVEEICRVVHKGCLVHTKRTLGSCGGGRHQHWDSLNQDSSLIVQDPKIWGRSWRVRPSLRVFIIINPNKSSRAAQAPDNSSIERSMWVLICRCGARPERSSTWAGSPKWHHADTNQLPPTMKVPLILSTRSGLSLFPLTCERTDPLNPDLIRSFRTFNCSHLSWATLCDRWFSSSCGWSRCGGNAGMDVNAHSLQGHELTRFWLGYC